MLSIRTLLERGPMNPDLNIKNKEDSIKKFFPSLWNAVSSDFQVFFPVLTHELPEEKKIWDSSVSGFPMNIMLNNANTPNAYTIPAIKSKLGAQVAMFTVPLYVVYGFVKLCDAKLDGVGSQKKVKMTAPNDLSALMWETKGLKSLIPEDNLRLAVMLHEIGHWVKFEYPLLNNTLNILSHAIPVLALPFAVLAVMMSRLGEKQADLFTKKVGYGKELSEALGRMGYYKRYDVSAIAKLGDHIRVFILKLQDKIDNYVPFLFSHPSIKNRKAYLKETIDQHFYNNIIGFDEYITELYDANLIEEGFRDFALEGLVKLFAPIDRLVAKHADFLFPLSQK